MSSEHPAKEIIAAQVARKIDADIPVPKYTLVVEITGNSQAEISQQIHALDVNWEYQYGQRDSIDSTDGRTSIVMEHTNPEQTPEAYTEHLLGWRDKRRATVSGSEVTQGTEGKA